MKLSRKLFAWLEASNMMSTWKNFMNAMVRKLTTLHYCLPRGKLSKLCQEGSMADYQAKFEETCTRVLGLPENFILEMYISELKDDIQAEVSRDKPQDIHEAFELSLLVENQRHGGKGGNYKPFTPKNTKVNPFIPKPDTIVPLNTSKPEENKLPIFKRLSPTERKERASKGLCFNCDDKFSPGHKCKGRIFKLSADEFSFWEVENDIEDHGEEDQDQEVSTDPIPIGQTEISFHAFEGHISGNTIRLDGYIKCLSVSVLVDTGSTHNFIQKEAAKLLKFTIHVIPPFKVFTGNGEKLIYDKVCKEVESNGYFSIAYGRGKHGDWDPRVKNSRPYDF